ncbi:MoaD/ThiS family protein [Roseibium sp.]|uniref:MoaD/ThiS family protein n=1 Tax=Roseibium sp. TaxID=1936156 RepID=UPI003D0D4015
MVKVNLWSGLTRFAGGETVISVEAATIGQMLDALVKAHPGLEPAIEAGVSIAIDGEIVTGGHHLKIAPDSEVHLLQQMKGG